MSTTPAKVKEAFRSFTAKIENIAAEQVEDRLKEVANYAIDISPEDTGAYVESFSLGRAGFSGGRMKDSEAKSRLGKKANGASKEIARGNLLGDIQRINVKQMLADGLVKFTLRNRAKHARDVENGEDWKRDGYHVFEKIKRMFR
jgi:hypothetical protein